MDAFEETYIVNRQAIYNYFLRVAGSSDLAEELTQDTFLRAFRFYSGFRGEAKARTWLARIAVNVWNSYCKRNRASIIDANTEFVPDCLDQIGARTEQLQIEQVFALLTEKERTIIVLRDINGFSYEEIASVMNINVGQVRIGLHRARKKFRTVYTSLEEEGFK